MFKEKHIFGFLVIALTGSHGFGPELVGILPMSLPQLPHRLRHLGHSQKRQKMKFKISMKILLSVQSGFRHKHGHIRYKGLVSRQHHPLCKVATAPKTMSRAIWVDVEIQ